MSAKRPSKGKANGKSKKSKIVDDDPALLTEDEDDDDRRSEDDDDVDEQIEENESLVSPTAAVMVGHATYLCGG